MPFDTITTLTNLTTVNLKYNRFNRFPIELNKMLNLKSLNLESNLMELLPRNINTMSNLEYLNLSRNMLKSVPIEFAEILETVREVDIFSNPWTDLPEKWGKTWAQDRQRDCPYGNSVTEAIDFLYAMKIFYNIAEEIWNEYGHLYYMNKLDLTDFIFEIQNRIPSSWHNGLIKHVEHVYFKVYTVFCIVILLLYYVWYVKYVYCIYVLSI